MNVAKYGHILRRRENSEEKKKHLFDACNAIRITAIIQLGVLLCVFLSLFCAYRHYGRRKQGHTLAAMQ